MSSLKYTVMNFKMGRGCLGTCQEGTLQFGFVRWVRQHTPSPCAPIQLVNGGIHHTGMWPCSPYITKPGVSFGQVSFPFKVPHGRAYQQAQAKNCGHPFNLPH